MHIQNINKSNFYSQNFKGTIVTLAEKNLGREIAENVVGVFNKKILPELSSESDRLSDEANFFALAAGAGTRFKIAKLLGNYNKVSMPIMPKEDTIHMLDFVLALSKPFMDNGGAKPIVRKISNGSLGGVVDYYMAGNPVKDTVICSADSVFGSDSGNLIEFFRKCIKDKKVHLSIIGGQRAPQDVVETYGILDLKKSNSGYTLKQFIEKPDLKTAKRYDINGKNAVNTGLFYVNKSAMTNLLNEINSGKNPIKKNDNEIYDFALAIQYIQSQCKKWFGKNSADNIRIKLSSTWKDTGEAKGFYELLQELKRGKYFQNFPKDLSKKIQTDLKQRVHLNDTIPYINFSKSNDISLEKIRSAQMIDGVKIVV